MKLLNMLCTATLLAILAGCAANPSTAKPNAAPAPTAEAKPAPAPPSRPKEKTMMTVDEVEKAYLESDIGMIHPSFGMFPWLQFDPTDPRPQGLAVQSLYLFSNKPDSLGRQKAVFGDGVIVVRMYRVDHQADGREVRTPVYTWNLDPRQAMPFRSHRRTIFGEGYGLMLQWPKDLDVLNKQIMVVVEFMRRDGKTIGSPPVFLQVPDKLNG